METVDSTERPGDCSGRGPGPSDRAGSGGIDLQAVTAVLLMVLLGSFTAAAAQVAVRELPVSIVPTVRFGVAGLCLIPLVWGTGSIQRLIREDAGLVIAAAALSVPINQGFFLNASRFAPTTHVAIFYAAVPLFVLALASLLGHERFQRRRLYGMLASVAGIAAIALGNVWGGEAAAPAGAGAATAGLTAAVLWGDALLVGAVASWAAYVTLSKPLVARHGAVPVLVGTFLLGALLDLPIALASASGWGGLADVSAASWIALAVLALVITPLGQVFQNVALRRLDASQVANFSNGSPVLTVLWGVWFFDEALTNALVIGGLLTLGGVFWASRAGSTAKPKSNSDPLRQSDPARPIHEPAAGIAAVRPCHAS